MNEELTYAQAIEELQQIVQIMEQSSIDPDRLLELVKRATYLLDFCEKKLLNVENEINQTLKYPNTSENT
ncbi:MAG: exodeoxyribonuclease VII small subunit [Bacteroidales bacterium]|nr:exodeoxyribonuclease VII small subunit [Bacteroidales bacterium]